MIAALMMTALLATPATVMPPSLPELVADYLDAYFEVYPSAATAAGLHHLDDHLETLDPATIERWLTRNRSLIGQLEPLLTGADTPEDDRLDAELVLAQARRELFDLGTLDRPRHDPLFWSGKIANATVFLLVRDDRPAAQRLSSAVARARQLPELAATARAALASGSPAAIAPELCAMAERQVRSSATFYREGFPRAAEGLGEAVEASAREAGVTAAKALDRFADLLGELAANATGTPLLGERYAESFRLATGVETPVPEVLARAEAALVAKRAEAAAFGRSVWREILGEAPVPADDVELLGALFSRVAEDRATTGDEFIDDYRQLIAASIEFVREHEVVTLPEPLTLFVDRSPSFFVGQSVGGVYPAGPYAGPASKTLLFLPTPPTDATAAERDVFYRDFNHHFNVMITPHEVIPGHYLQLKWAARHPRKVRAMFSDGVYVEGWGTFCERLMLDLGWGGPLDRLAHLKKQLENIARTIVDIRVHTGGMERDEVLRFVREEALQEEQFAANMWRRAITSSPQLTSYFLGYEEVHGLYEAVREARGERFVLKEFMDAMMELGPVAVGHYRSRLLRELTPESPN